MSSELIPKTGTLEYARALHQMCLGGADAGNDGVRLLEEYSICNTELSANPKNEDALALKRNAFLFVEQCFERIFEGMRSTGKQKEAMELIELFGSELLDNYGNIKKGSLSLSELSQLNAEMGCFFSERARLHEELSEKTADQKEKLGHLNAARDDYVRAAQKFECTIREKILDAPACRKNADRITEKIAAVSATKIC